MVDIHLHIGGKGNSSPCKMSKRFLSSPAYLYMVVRSGIPLLCHTGPEHAIPVIKREYQGLGDPRKLKLALNTGVKVIAAHCASSFFPWEDSYLNELTEMLEEADRRGWRLYADISAMCTLFRASIIDDILRKIPRYRMVFGSDYPIPIDDMPPHFVETLDLQEFLRISKINNPIEKNYQQLLAMDFPEDAMTRGSEFLHIPR